MRGKGNELSEGEWDKERKAEWEGGEGEEGRHKGLSKRRKKQGAKEPILDGDCILRFC